MIYNIDFLASDVCFILSTEGQVTLYDKSNNNRKDNTDSIQGLDLQQQLILHDNHRHDAHEQDWDHHPAHDDDNFSIGLSSQVERSRCRSDQHQVRHPLLHDLHGRKHTLSWPHLQLNRDLSSSPDKQTTLIFTSKEIEGSCNEDKNAGTTSSSSSDRDRPSSTSSADLNKHVERSKEDEYVMECRDDDNKSSLKDNADKLFNALERLSFTESYTTRLLTTSDSQDEDDEDR